MNKAELLAGLKTERQNLLSIIEGLSDEVLAEQAVLGEWTIKDLLSHLTVWESELVTLIAFTRQGRRPQVHSLNATPEVIDALNAKWYAEYKARPLDRVLADFHGVRKQTIRQVEALTDEELVETKKYPWLKGIPLWKWIAESSFAHEAEHIPQLREWHDARVA